MENEVNWALYYSYINQANRYSTKRRNSVAKQNELSAKIARLRAALGSIDRTINNASMVKQRVTEVQQVNSGEFRGNKADESSRKGQVFHQTLSELERKHSENRGRISQKLSELESDLSEQIAITQSATSNMYYYNALANELLY
ncbi:hypothetical protein [Streptococcus oriscaviae]|uniref:DUF5082 domain-containing protein n=1 Tax=Streptococcus oriscaviae TaxID=2781599 RepID=A0ABX7YNP8_9STRE|nr:hypothetical protein [Streptococcus oriscaviae]QUE55206.1 hypothetical protein INT76_04855 [Streptococcus oriscaviae]